MIRARRRRTKDGIVWDVRCGLKCHRLRVYAPEPGTPEDDLYEVGGVIGTKAEWRRLLRRIGLGD